MREIFLNIVLCNDNDIYKERGSWTFRNKW
jgi:hypothetical protein